MRLKRFGQALHKEDNFTEDKCEDDDKDDGFAKYRYYIMLGV